MNWTRDLVGKSKTYFEDYNSIKTVLGEKSPNYNSRIVKFTDPDTNQKVTAKINKVNFARKNRKRKKEMGLSIGGVFYLD